MKNLLERDLNGLRPPDWRAGALPNELHVHVTNYIGSLPILAISFFGGASHT